MSEAVSLEQVKKYRYNTQKLCLWLREVQHFADAKAAGHEIDQGKFIYACKMCEEFKARFLESKEALGYDDRFAFMEDNKFFGFSIENGRFVGNVSKEEIFEIVDKWFYGFPETANHYQFEVSYYVLTQSDPNDYSDKLYEDYKP